ncbi:hypothetical protein [Burkholderia stagnalis]|uniref:hypothetical protein n=1 Tax=Burkholderia stagnalis TaxID=1503054 RepID=UPI000F5D67AF|nr:hypothetical protein [Burkholderia stagnalis]
MKIFHRDVLMIKNSIFLMIVIVSGSVCAKSTCADLQGRQSYPPLNTKSGTVCFIRESILDDKTGVPIGLDGISLYYVADGSVPMKAEGRGLLYDDTPGEIMDAFSLMVGRDRREKVFVIHSFEVRNSLVEPNSSGKFYSVSVFEPIGNILRQDGRSTDWFGVGYGWLSNGRKMVWKYPYQSRKDVRQAIDSPFALLMNGFNSIPVRVRSKTYLFDESSIRGRTKKYLIEGGRAMVGEVTAGWCKINYSGGAKPMEMWLMCSALDVEGKVRRMN